jgi:hypothetical protein
VLATAWYRPVGMAALRAWEVFADALLHRAVRTRQRSWGRGLDPLAGTVVVDADIDRLVADLPLVRLTRDAATDPSDEALDDGVELAREGLHHADTDDEFSRLVAVARLDEVSTEVLALLAAIGWEPTRLRLAGYVQDDLAVRGVMLAALPLLLGRGVEVLDCLAPERALRRSCLLVVGDEQQAGSATVTVAPSVQWHLLGSPSIDADLPLDTMQFDGEPVGDAPPLALVHGPDRIRRLQAAAELVGTSRLLTSPEPATDAQWEALIRTALCADAVPVLDVTAPGADARRWITRTPMVPWVLSSRFPINLDHLPAMPFVEADVEARPLHDDEVRAALGAVPDGHRLSADQLHLLSRHGELDARHAVRRLVSGELDSLAVRIRPRRQWHELVLPAEPLAQVRDVLVRVRHRNRVYDEWGYRPVPSAGVLALFAGPSGTGKTMSAEIIAGELGLDMFKVDLSSMVSKYIGETEKNLERVFNAAEGGGVVLVFDEADALFGKRTGVGDAKDRYANIETSYLLQRLETYDGLVVLTSNFPGNIDHAFMRRIHVAVEFPMPGVAERRAIWEASFPPGAPVGDIDFDALAARFEFAGGSIRAAVLTAAFAAADEGVPVSMRHVTHGVRREFLKLGRIVNMSGLD